MKGQRRKDPVVRRRIVMALVIWTVMSLFQMTCGKIERWYWAGS